MFTEFINLPDTARVWVYQANRSFTDAEVNFITTQATDFLNHWKRHGEDLKASYTIKYNQFLVIAVDESFTAVSGCSIDASVHFIKQLQSALNIDLLDKMNLAFKQQDEVFTVTLPDFQKYIAEGKITEKTIVFNNMVTTKQELQDNWEVPVAKSWHKRFLLNKVNEK